MQVQPLQQAPDAAAAADVVPAAQGKPLPQARAYPGHTAPGEQQQLGQAVFGLRKLPALFLPGQAPQAMPAVPQGGDDVALHGGLEVQVQPVGIFPGVPGPVLQVLPPELPDAAPLLRRDVDVVDVFMHKVLFHNQDASKSYKFVTKIYDTWFSPIRQGISRELTAFSYLIPGKFRKIRRYLPGKQPSGG